MRKTGLGEGRVELEERFVVVCGIQDWAYLGRSMEEFVMGICCRARRVGCGEEGAERGQWLCHVEVSSSHPLAGDVDKDIPYSTVEIVWIVSETGNRGRRQCEDGWGSIIQRFHDQFGILAVEKSIAQPPACATAAMNPSLVARSGSSDINPAEHDSFSAKV